MRASRFTRQRRPIGLSWHAAEGGGSFASKGRWDIPEGQRNVWNWDIANVSLTTLNGQLGGLHADRTRASRMEEGGISGAGIPVVVTPSAQRSALKASCGLGVGRPKMAKISSLMMVPPQAKISPAMRWGRNIATAASSVIASATRVNLRMSTNRTATWRRTGPSGSSLSANRATMLAPEMARLRRLSRPSDPSGRAASRRWR